MARFKDVNWVLPESQNSSVSLEAINLALLMDIRDELKALNRLLHCSTFLDLPNQLERIAYNTKPKKKANLKLAKKREA